MTPDLDAIDAVRCALEDAANFDTLTFAAAEVQEIMDALDSERARADALQKQADCDCVPCIISSKACRKCGRIATIPQEQMVRSVKELQARAEGYRKALEAIEAR